VARSAVVYHADLSAEKVNKDTVQQYVRMLDAATKSVGAQHQAVSESRQWRMR
jgi:hypothetical protein